jgi:hypothetical protein
VGGQPGVGASAAAIVSGTVSIIAGITWECVKGDGDASVGQLRLNPLGVDAAPQDRRAGVGKVRGPEGERPAVRADDMGRDARSLQIGRG